MLLLMLGVCAHLYMIVHLCMFISDFPQQVSAGAINRIYSFLSVSFSQATKECIEHPHVQAINQCESRREKNWGRRDNTKGESGRFCVCLSTCIIAREEEERGRELRESPKWDSKERSAQIDIAITKKAIPQLGIYLHTLEPGCSSATLSLRLAWQCLIQKRSTQKGCHWAVTVCTLTMKTTSIVLIAHTTRGRKKKHKSIFH